MVAPGKDYHARVAAVNSVGTGSFTASGMTRAASPPSMNDNVSVKALSDQEISVDFGEALKNGDTIDKYRIEYTNEENFGAKEQIRLRITVNKN